jgi:hypothetical protein
MNVRFYGAILLGALTLLSPTRAGATTTVPVSVAELTQSADDVIVGVVRRSTSRWEEGFIVTDHDVEVTMTLKGRAPLRSVVTVRVAGGVVGRIAQRVVGAPSLEDGHTYMLFLAGGVSTVRYLAHMTAAVVPVTLATTGAVQVSVPGTLMMAPSSPSSRAQHTTTLLRLDVLTRAVRMVSP